MAIWPLSALRSTIIVLGFGMIFSPLAKGAEAAPKTPPTAASPVPMQPELYPSVRAVGVHTRDGERRNVNTIQAQRGDQIWVDVHNFRSWVDSLSEKDRPQNHDIKDLILYLDHFPLLGVAPTYWHERK